jgi:cell division protein ZapA
MSSEDVTRVSVKILDKEYHVACPPEEQAALKESADYLHRKMREIRETGKIIGTDRIAVMAALNLANDLLKAKKQEVLVETNLHGRVRGMRERIETELQKTRQLEF